MVVGGVGGAAPGGKGGGRRAELEKKRKAWANQVELDKIKAGAAFDSMPWDAAGSLPAAQVPALLAEVMGVDTDTLDADGYGLVVNHALKVAGLTEEADALPRAALLDSVSKYRYYLARRATIDKMFAQFDLDANGKLDRRELRKALQSREHKNTRAVHSIVVELRVMNSDIEAILDDADANSDGCIDRSEMLPALAAWSNIADMKIEKKKSAACALQ